MNNYNRLREAFNDCELEWKPQSVGIKNGKPWAMILCYVQARAIQNRLDEVFGPMNWKDEYRFEQNGVICRLSVYCNEKKEWIAKENGSPETDIESFKGGISGAFKRVASSGYGIGRYLYELDTTFAECSMTKQKGYKQAKTKDNQYFYWQVPTSIDSVSKKSQPTQQNLRERNEWETKLLEQANNDEGILREISEAWHRGIKSEKQYYFFARNLADRGFPSDEIEPTVCSQELNAEKIEYDHVRGIKI
jgi:hypothetical protein